MQMMNLKVISNTRICVSINKEIDDDRLLISIFNFPNLSRETGLGMQCIPFNL